MNGKIHLVKRLLIENSFFVLNIGFENEFFDFSL